MRNLLANLTIKQKFRVLILAILIGFGIFGWQTLRTLSLVKVNGALYRDIVSGKDLTADILPPPEYILESYLTVYELNNETDVYKIEKGIELLAQLKINYLHRHEYWLNQLHNKTLETVFLRDSFEPAMRFYEVVENRFIPAVRKSDVQMQKRLLEGEIKEAYLEHREQIDKVVSLASTWSSTIEKNAQNTTDSSIIALVVLISIVLGCIVILSLYLVSLISSEEKYRKFFKDDLSGVYLATPQGKILDCNQAFAKMFGFDSVEAVLNSNTETLYMKPDDLQYFLDRLRNEKKLFNYEEVLKKQNGQQIITLENVIGIFDKHGELTSFQGYIFDITEHRQAEFEIRTTNKILSEERKMFVDGPVVVFKWKNEEGWPVEYVSPNVENVFGYAAEELTSGKIPYADIILKEDIERIGMEVTSYSASGVENFVHKPYRIIRKDGKIIWIDDYTTILRDENQKITHYQGYVIDITEHNLVEEKLQFANTILRTQQEVSIDGVLVVNEEGRIISFNQRFVNMWGIPTEIIEAHSDERAVKFVMDRLVKPKEFAARIEYLYNHPEVKSFEEIELKEGIVFERYSAPMIGPDKNYYGRVWFFHDITGRKRSEEELRKHREQLEELVLQRTQELEAVHKELVRKERLATLGQLTAIVSHELRNPLGTIRNSIFELNERLHGKNSGLEKVLDRAERNIIRCDKIIEELLDYTRETENIMAPFLIDEWISNFLDEAVIPEKIKLVRKLNAGVEVSLNPESFRRCLINLIDNAVQAMTTTDKRSTSRKITPLSNELIIETVIEDGNLKIKIKDNGTGIDEEGLKKIFEPLYSTKGFGVGLGLPIVKKIIEQHNGGIEIISQNGEGTIAVLRLPVIKNNKE